MLDVSGCVEGDPEGLNWISVDVPKAWIKLSHLGCIYSPH